MQSLFPGEHFDNMHSKTQVLFHDFGFILPLENSPKLLDQRSLPPSSLRDITEYLQEYSLLRERLFDIPDSQGFTWRILKGFKGPFSCLVVSFVQDVIAQQYCRHHG